jgi:glycosyltransferase involved in cell wall biosynthesis
MLCKLGALRVLLVTARYFPFMGGVENHVYQTARRLAGAGTDTTVLTTDPSGLLPSHEQSDGVTIQRVRAWPATQDFYFAPDIYRVITRGQWDIVHCQGYHTLVAPLTMLAALHSGIPYVVTFHGGGHSSRLRTLLRGPQRALLRPLLARAERLIAIARFEIDFYGKQLRLPGDHFVYIPNGSDLPRATQPAPVAPQRTIIASVGRLERYKGHHRILGALPKVLEQRPDVHLWIAGVGPYEPTLRRMAATLGVADHVEIRAIPAADRAAMASRLSRVALVTLLSDFETHPLAVLEALALGRPALVARSSGMIELAERGLAHAIPLASTPDEIAAAVLRQLEKPLVPAQVDLPTWDECTAQLLDLYHAITNTRRLSCAF